MKCIYCGAEAGAQNKFCEHCGKPLVRPQANEVIRCVQCGSPMSANDIFCQRCGWNRRAEQNDTQRLVLPQDQPTFVPVKRKVKRKKNGSLILGIVLTVVIVVGIGIVGYFMSRPSEDEKDGSNVASAPTGEPVMPTEGTGDYVIDGAIPTESVAYRTEAPNQTSGLVTDPVYRTYQDSDYHFYCAVPTHFIQDSGATRWYAADNTAQMQIYARNNSNHLSATDAMNEYARQIGGTTTYTAKGEDWFAISIEKDGMSYYMKGFVDHYVREFSFSFPSEYLDVYSPYIEYIEDHFKRTDN